MPQQAASKLACLVLSSARSCPASVCPGRVYTAWLVSLVVVSCCMVSKWWHVKSTGCLWGGWCAVPTSFSLCHSVYFSIHLYIHILLYISCPSLNISPSSLSLLLHLYPCPILPICQFIYNSFYLSPSMYIPISLIVPSPFYTSPCLALLCCRSLSPSLYPYLPVAATLKLIFSANKFWPTVLAPFYLSGILVEILFWNFQLFILI